MDREGQGKEREDERRAECRGRAASWPPGAALASSRPSAPGGHAASRPDNARSTSLRSLRSHGREAQHRAASYHSPSDVAIGIPIPENVPRLTADGCRPGSDSTIAALRAPGVHGSRGQRHPNTQSANGLRLPHGRKDCDAEPPATSPFHPPEPRPSWRSVPCETPPALGVERSTQPRAQRPPQTVATGTKRRRVADQLDYRSCLIPASGGYVTSGRVSEVL